MGCLVDKVRWLRVAFGGAVVLVLALGAGGDVAGRRDSIDVSAPLSSARDVVAAGFSYGDWLDGRRVVDYADYAKDDNRFSVPASFWRQSIARIDDDIKRRLRSALLGVVPDASEVRDILLRYGNDGEVDIGEWRQLREAQLRRRLGDLPYVVIADSERALADALGLAATCLPITRKIVRMAVFGGGRWAPNGNRVMASCRQIAIGL